MERIRYLAELSVKRALAFAGLAVGMVILGLSFDPVLALKSGAALLTMTSAILFYKGLAAPRRNVRHTELWILLDRKISLPDAHMQRVLGQVLRETYFRYAEMAGYVAVGLWVASLVYVLID